jgi:uncharacterized Fe-S center protein
MKMASEVLFASVRFNGYDPEETLPRRFARLIDAMNIKDAVADKWTAVKMHLGREIGYTTIHPLFVKILVDKLKEYGAKPFVTEQTTQGARVRGYTEEFLGVPIVPVCGVMDKYFYEKHVDFRTLQNVDIGGYIHDAEALIDLSHVKGHGSCGYGGACKNIAMGCVTDRTRNQIHSLEGGLVWNEGACIHCRACITSCNHHANSFTDDGRYEVSYHNCTTCQHCVKVCPTGALALDDHNYTDFQEGMALATKTVLDTFEPGRVFYINFLTNITVICDCWGISTPSVVPDIGVMASRDLVAVERACLDAIKVENYIPGSAPEWTEPGESGHLFERIHGKNPFIQLEKLEQYGLGTQNYEIVPVK